MRIKSAFPRRARRVDGVWIPMPDGVRLSARIWLPEDAEQDPVPAILEYIPYRKDDATAVRDAGIHPYFAGHGYASVRVDLRGSGDSEGILRDEYLPQEQEDGVEVIRWLADQPWCTGAVGMIGKSWGGFNGLQVAAHAPPELKAVVSVCSTDDRYADDVHYIGGCVFGALHALVGVDDARLQRPPARPCGRRRTLARALAGTARADAPLRRSVAFAPAPRRLLEAGLRLRGLRGDPLCRVHGRRLGRRLPERDPPLPRRLSGPTQGPDRALGAPLPARRHPRARHRLPAGVPALVRPLAQGSRDGNHGRAAASCLDARLGASERVVCRTAGTVGGGAALAVPTRDRSGALP